MIPLNNYINTFLGENINYNITDLLLLNINLTTTQKNKLYKDIKNIK